MPPIPPSASPGRLILAKLALLSLPLWILGAVPQPRALYLRQIRFAVAMGGVAVLAFVFLKQHLMDQRLLHLLKHSRKSFDNLQRLQGTSHPAGQAGFARRTGRARRRRTGVPALGHPEQFGTHGRQQQPQPRATRERAENRPAGPAHSRTGQRSAQLRPADSGRKESSRTEASCCSARFKWKDSSSKTRRSA
jgi:hypothetical protein